MAIKYYDSLNVASTDASNFAGDVLIEDNLYLTDAGTTRAKIQLNSSDRDDLDINAVSLGSNIKFFTVNTERMRITSSGSVGIGTTSPNEKLQVAGNIHAYAPSGVNAELAASTAAGSTTVSIRSSGITHFNGGNVGIGTTSPAEELTVIGDANITGKFAVGIAATHASFDFYNQGTAYFNGAVTVDDTLDLVNLKVSGAQGTDGQVLTSTGSGVAWEDVSGGSSPWTADTNGITYTAGNVGIGMASVAGIDLAVDGLVRFYNEFRVNGNTQIDGELSVLDSTSLSGDLSLNGNDILTEGGDILDNTDSAGAVNSFLISKGTGNGVRWVPVTAASFDAVTSVTSGEPTGSDSLINIVSLTQAEYDAGTPVATTLYIIT